MAKRSAQRATGTSSDRRAHRAFWLLAAVSVLAIGSISSALTAPPGTLTAMRVAGSGAVLLGSLTLSTRVMIAIIRARQRARRS